MFTFSLKIKIRAVEKSNYNGKLEQSPHKLSQSAKIHPIVKN